MHRCLRCRSGHGAAGFALTLTLSMAVAGCLSPIALHRAVVEYDRAASEIQAEMLLLNIARSRHFEPLHFTALSSVTATFEFTTSAGVLPAQAGLTETLAAPSFNASVAEKPTLSIVPIEGEEFTRRILSPMNAERIAFLFQQGVEPAILLRLMARELVVLEEGRHNVLSNDPQQRESYAEFRRRVLHISSLNQQHALQVGPIVYEEMLPVTLPQDPESPHLLGSLDQVLKALDSGYTWKRTTSNAPPVLTRQVVGRIAITNYDLSQLSNEERRRLNEEAQAYPANSVFVLIRSDAVGGEYPLRGQFVLRSFDAIVRFLANGISAAPEFHVGKDPRTGPVPRNPPWTIVIEETEEEPDDVAFKVRHKETWFSIRKAPKIPGVVFAWNQEAFRILNQLFQMTVTDVARRPTPSITIAQ